MHPDRDTGRSPLFRVMFALQNAPLPALRSPELGLTPLEAPSGTAKFDLSLFAAEGPEGLRLAMEYSSDLFDPATIDRMLAHYRVLLESIVAEPDQPIGLLPMLTDEERRQVLAGWGSGGSAGFLAGPEGPSEADLDALLNPLSPSEPSNHESHHHDPDQGPMRRSRPGRPSAKLRCVHRWIEAQAARAPESVALTCGGESLTYAELNARANRLARRLRPLGVGPEILVGLCAHRSLDMVAALLAVLKAGGAYVPLDPSLSARSSGLPARGR